MNKIIVTLFITIAMLFISKVNGGVSIYNDGYGDDIIPYQSTNSTEISEGCRGGMTKCVSLTTDTENGFYGFSNTDSFISNDCRYIEFSIKVIAPEGSTVFPVIQCSVQTVSIPIRVTLNTSDYVQTGKSTESNDDNFVVDLSQWSFVRIKSSDLNIDAPTFNSFQIWADQKGTTILFGEATYLDAPTSLLPLGTIHSNSVILKPTFITILLLILSMCTLLF